MSVTEIDLCNRALSLVGGERITSLEDDTAEAEACRELYPFELDNLLGLYEWRHASGSSQLARLVDEPEHQWDAAYQLPAGIALLQGVFVNDEPIPFERFENRVLCNAGTNDIVVANYTFEPRPDRFPPFFRSALVLALAASLALALPQDASMSEALLKRADRAIAFAKNKDAQGRSARKFNTNRFIAQRRSVRL